MNILFNAFFFLFSLLSLTSLNAYANEVKGLDTALEKPLIERYIMDELKIKNRPL